MLQVTDGLVPLHGSTLNWNTRKDMITQWQMHLAKLLLTGPRHSEINPWWSHIGTSTSGQSSWPCHNWGQPPLGARGACCCRTVHLYKCMLLIGLKPRKRTQCWVQCWTGWRHRRRQDLKALLAEHASSEEGRLILWNQQNFTIHQGALYLHSMPKGETKDLLLFVVPRAHHVTTLNGCHRDAGHQGCDHTLSLLWEHFWWPGMTNQMWQSIKSCMHVACNMRAIYPKCTSTPSCGHHSNGPLACRLY